MSVDELRVKLLRLRRKNLKLDLMLRQKKLVPRANVLRAWSLRCNDCRAQLESLPAIVAELGPEDFAARQRLREAAAFIVHSRLFQVGGKADEFPAWWERQKKWYAADAAERPFDESLREPT